MQADLINLSNLHDFEGVVRLYSLMDKTHQKSQDLVILVDSNNQVLGHQDKIKAHSEGLLHRAASVFLFNQNRELLIQKRSESKIVAAGKWANTVCGNVSPGERSEECGVRRLREELGIFDLSLNEVGVFRYKHQFNNGFSEHEIDRVFVGKYEGKASLNPVEVSGVKWVAWKELLADVNDAKTRYAPWLKIILNQSEIMQKIEGYLSNER
jgi:isopentenyl-diphosphate delta-isomerase